MAPRGDLRTIVVLAFMDLRHERQMSFCYVLGLSAVLAPLLILFGMKFGVISTMTQRLMENPRTREIRHISQGRFDQAWFDRLAARPEVAFLIPDTRILSSTITLINHANPETPLVKAEMFPTDTGDVLLAGEAVIPRGPDQIVLTKSAAEKLRAGPGTVLRGRIGRISRVGRQAEEVTLKVTGVLPLRLFRREAAFVTLPFLLAAEDYREGYSVPVFGWTGKPRPAVPRFFASFRLFARTMDDVIPLRDRLAAAEVETATRAAEIDLVRRMDWSLTLLFLVIAGMAGVGYVVSLAAHLWASVVRKQRDLSILRLMGFSTRAIALFPVTQATLIAGVGWLLAVVLYYVSSGILNALFAVRVNPGEVVCLLYPLHFAGSFLVTMLVALVASAYSGIRAARTPPAQGLRQE